MKLDVGKRQETGWEHEGEEAVRGMEEQVILIKLTYTYLGQCKQMCGTVFVLHGPLRLLAWIILNR